MSTLIDNGEVVEIIATELVTGKELLQVQKIYTPDKLPKQRYHIIDEFLCTNVM